MPRNKQFQALATILVYTRLSEWPHRNFRVRLL